jgi:hypothetical protein
MRKEAEEMYHYMQFDPSLIGERNRQIFGEVQTLRLEERLRKHHEGSGSPLAAFAIRLKSMLRLLRGAGLAGR